MFRQRRRGWSLRCAGPPSETTPTIVAHRAGEEHDPDHRDRQREDARRLDRHV